MTKYGNSVKKAIVESFRVKKWQNFGARILKLQ
jgi:hypothetical protein